MSLENFKNRKIEWDTVNKNFDQTVQIVSGDVNSRTVTIVITDNGEPINLTGYSVKLVYKYIYNDISGFVMLTPTDASKGEFSLTIPTEMTSPGSIKSNLILLNENLEQVIVSKNLKFISDDSTVTDLAQEVNSKIDDFTKLLLENMPQVMRSELNDLHAQTESNTSNIELKANSSDMTSLQSAMRDLENEVAAFGITPENLVTIKSLLDAIANNATDSEVAELINSVNVLTSNISLMSDGDYSPKANKTDLESLQSTVNNQSASISTKANQTDLDNLKTDVTSQGIAISKKAEQAEIIQARGGQSSLNARLDGLDAKYTDLENETTAQLAQKANQTYVDSKVQEISLSYKESYDTLALLQVAYPTGDVYNHTVLSDGMIYTYANDTWTSTGIQANGTGIAPTSVSPYQLAERHLIANAQGKNMFDKSQVIPDKAVNTTNGNTYVSAGRYLSKKIYVGENIALTKTYGDVTMYDVNGLFLGGIPYTAKHFTTPPNTNHLLISVNIFDHLQNLQLELGNVETEYETGLPKITKEFVANFDEDVKQLIDNHEKLQDTIVYTPIVNKNLFNKMRVTPDKYIVSSDGIVRNAVGRYLSDKIYLNPSTNYIKTFGDTAFYDVNDVYISGITYSTKPFTTPSNVSYMLISVNAYTHLETLQVEEGTVATPYESGLPLILPEQIKTDKASIVTPYQNVITVAKTGGDYTKIMDAVNAITDDSPSNQYTIMIAPGVYVESVKLLGRFISLRGYNCESTIIKTFTNDYYNPPIDLCANSHLYDLTFIADVDDTTPVGGKNGMPAYAIHFDISSREGSRTAEQLEGRSISRNCRFISKNQHAAGIGLTHKQHLIFEDCEFESFNNPAFRAHNYSGTGAIEQKMTVKNCVMHNGGTHTPIILQDPNNAVGGKDNVDTIFTFQNVIAYSETNGQTNAIIVHTPLVTGAVAGKILLGKGSFGNSIDELNA